LKWKFTLDVTGLSSDALPGKVEKEAALCVSRTGEAPSASVFKLTIRFQLRRGRYLTENPRLPREDRGGDLDNLVKPVIDALGPIIGYRKKWLSLEGGGYREVGTRTAADAKVIEIVASKENSGSDQENLSVEIEAIRG
jgi:hypothetical protein